jgi:hypothetical protein
MGKRCGYPAGSWVSWASAARPVRREGDVDRSLKGLLAALGAGVMAPILGALAQSDRPLPAGR